MIRIGANSPRFSLRYKPLSRRKLPGWRVLRAYPACLGQVGQNKEMECMSVRKFLAVPRFSYLPIQDMPIFFFHGKTHDDINAKPESGAARQVRYAININIGENHHAQQSDGQGQSSTVVDNDLSSSGNFEDLIQFRHLTQRPS